MPSSENASLQQTAIVKNDKSTLPWHILREIARVRHHEYATYDPRKGRRARQTPRHAERHVPATWDYEQFQCKIPGIEWMRTRYIHVLAPLCIVPCVHNVRARMNFCIHFSLLLPGLIMRTWAYTFVGSSFALYVHIDKRVKMPRSFTCSCVVAYANRCKHITI